MKGKKFTNIYLFVGIEIKIQFVSFRKKGSKFGNNFNAAIFGSILLILSFNVRMHINIISIYACMYTRVFIYAYTCIHMHALSHTAQKPFKNNAHKKLPPLFITKLQLYLTGKKNSSHINALCSQLKKKLEKNS
eukprot:TRINITY_DN51622_c0_g1_i1.p2 TRINITY_DN51622_c0_g1~~TRINITY_DN51622_c0_g1_i1.p2  ORF type:complete len:148 (-),score=1.27 TRINITY_DN51622_c0_g1_i1:290-691(-)